MNFRLQKIKLRDRTCQMDHKAHKGATKTTESNIVYVIGAKRLRIFALKNKPLRG